ncbi:MAG: hypothetical protein ABI780_12995, partial [Ardenticatenales bacterium]
MRQRCALRSERARSRPTIRPPRIGRLTLKARCVATSATRATVEAARLDALPVRRGDQAAAVPWADVAKGLDEWASGRVGE